MGARFDLFDAQPHAFVRGFAEAARLDGGFADIKHATGVAVVAVLDHRDVNIDDVAVLQLLVSGNAVTDLVVDRGADGLGLGLVAWRRIIERRQATCPAPSPSAPRSTTKSVTAFPE